RTANHAEISLPLHAHNSKTLRKPRDFCAPPRRQILIGFDSIVGAIPMASEETVRAEIGHVLMATWPWLSKGYVIVRSSAQLQRGGTPMACFGRLTGALRFDYAALATAIRDSPEIWLGISLNLGCPVQSELGPLTDSGTAKNEVDGLQRVIGSLRQ